mmetsp:Transcript_6703/g.22391  ORF Transcript_6703/g.22391 Transcript_6703/m.22391 type:complete len:380 (-) Transcript_6703:210-1349(-)
MCTFGSGSPACSASLACCLSSSTKQLITSSLSHSSGLRVAMSLRVIGVLLISMSFSAGLPGCRISLTAASSASVSCLGSKRRRPGGKFSSSTSSASGSKNSCSAAAAAASAASRSAASPASASSSRASASEIEVRLCSRAASCAATSPSHPPAASTRNRPAPSSAASTAARAAGSSSAATASLMLCASASASASRPRPPNRYKCTGVPACPSGVHVVSTTAVSTATALGAADASARPSGAGKARSDATHSTSGAALSRPHSSERSWSSMQREATYTCVRPHRPHSSIEPSVNSGSPGRRSSSAAESSAASRPHDLVAAAWRVGESSTPTERSRYGNSSHACATSAPVPEPRSANEQCRPPESRPNAAKSWRAPTRVTSP